MLFEAAHWDPVDGRPDRPPAQAVQRGGQALGAGRRPGTLPWSALERAVALLTEYGGGTTDPEILDIDDAPAVAPIRLAADLPARTAGVPYPAERVVELLSEVGCAVTGADPLTVTPPTWRPDLTDPADLVEEYFGALSSDRSADRSVEPSHSAEPSRTETNEAFTNSVSRLPVSACDLDRLRPSSDADRDGCHALHCVREVFAP